MIRLTRKHKNFLTTFLIAAFLIPRYSTAQTALHQLEAWAGQSASSVYAPAPSNPYGGGGYRVPFKKSDATLRQEARDHYDKGLREMNSRNWEEAVRLLKKAVRKDNSNSYYSAKLQEAERALEAERAANKAYQEKKKREEEQYRQQQAEQNRLEAARIEKERREQEAIHQKLEDAENTILAFRKDIKNAQGYMKNYIKALQNNNSELEKWAATTDEAYNNVLNNSKGYLAGMFIKYNLMGCLKGEVQKDVFKKMGNLMHSSNPAIQKWLANQLKMADIRMDKLQDVIDRVSLGGDLAEIIGSDPEKAGYNLKILSFLNGVLETSHITAYETFMKKYLGAMPGEYFEQAKMIGETYSDLAAICYSWYSIRKLNTDNEDMAQKVALLSAGMEQRMHEIECLKDCMKNYTDRCLENCTGKTRWSTPPPPLMFEYRKW